MLRRPKNSPLCPYTTLFRSRKSTRLNSSHTIISYCLSSDVCSSDRSEEHTSELQSHDNLVCRLLLEHKAKNRSGVRRSGLTRGRFVGAVVCATDRAPPPRPGGDPPLHPRPCAAAPPFFFFNEAATPETPSPSPPRRPSA